MLTLVAWASVMALGVLSVLCWRRFKNLSFMEQFLDYRQVPTATEANESTEQEENGHVKEKKKLPGVGTGERGMSGGPLPEFGRPRSQDF